MSITKIEEATIQSIKLLKTKCDPALLKDKKVIYSDWSTAKAQLKIKDFRSSIQNKVNKKNSPSDSLDLSIYRLRSKISAIDNVADYLLIKIGKYKNYVERNRLEIYDESKKRLTKLNHEFSQCQIEANKIIATSNKIQLSQSQQDQVNLLHKVISNEPTTQLEENLTKTVEQKPKNISPQTSSKQMSQKGIDDAKLQAFRKIYKALYEGQSSFFKDNLSYFNWVQSDIPVERVAKYARANPNSRSARAWELAQVHYQKPTVNNLELFKEIHKTSYEKSSTFFFFKRSSNFPNCDYENANIQELINHAENDSRTGMIRDVLST